MAELHTGTLLATWCSMLSLLPVDQLLWWNRRGLVLWDQNFRWINKQGEKRERSAGPKLWRALNVQVQRLRNLGPCLCFLGSFSWCSPYPSIHLPNPQQHLGNNNFLSFSLLTLPRIQLDKAAPLLSHLPLLLLGSWRARMMYCPALCPQPPGELAQ